MNEKKYNFASSEAQYPVRTIRIIAKNSVKDVQISELERYTVGSGKNDDYVLADTKLGKSYARIENNGKTIEAFFKQATDASGEKVKHTTLHPSEFYLLSNEDRVALIAMGNYPLACELHEIDTYDEITVGRGNDNTVVIASKLIGRHHMRIRKENGTWTIWDGDGAERSTNGTFVNSQAVDYRNLNEDDLIAIGDATIRFGKNELLVYYMPDRVSVKVFESIDPSSVHSDDKKIQFNRSPRIKLEVPRDKIEIPAPPTLVSKPEINWLSTLLPAGITVAIAVTMALAFQNTMMMLYSIPMAVAGVFVSVTNYLRGKKTYKRSLEERSAAYLQKLDEIENKIKKKREDQKKALLLADPAPEECLATVKTRSTKLWCRVPSDSDFITVRLGTGTVPFSVTLDRPQEQLMEQDELRKKPGEIFRANSMLENMPILCDIRSSGVVGLLGTSEQTRTQLQNMIIHLATHHCCTELKIVCFYNEKDREELSWLADLPHTHDEAWEENYLASTQEEADTLFKTFTESFKQRKQEVNENNSYGGDLQFIPYVLFVFFEPKLLKKNNPINQYLFEERSLGIGCLMAAEKMAQLPKQCTEIVSLSDGEGELYNTARASERQGFRPDDISAAFRRTFGQLIRPLYCDEGIEVSSLPKSYTFYQMLGINSMDEYDIGKSWSKTDLLDAEFKPSLFAPTAPIGILENGNQLFFNSPPIGVNGGPHALVAGTPGAGKSETLLTLILSLALRYPPEEVSFLVIDFKGASIASVLTGLPHVRGVITNLDGEELRRSLVSIGAENDRRMRLFSEYNKCHPEDKEQITDILTYTKKYRQSKVSEPLPHLFIVVDEFAEMKKQLPEIMNQFVSTALVGRSLGVKLILATQSPSGIVDAKIRATILKQVCLKVANAGESRDMIDTDLAAHIKEAGRGYLKVDNDSPQIFQSAYGGVKVKLSDGSESTQIREAVDAIAAYCRSHEIQKLPDIFCPPLPVHTAYPQNNSEENAERQYGQLPVGIRDDPATQFMGEYDMDVFSRNTLIVGSQQMGKTNLLQTILRGVAERYSPDEVNVYILEFASLFLTNFETLPQVGGVVTLQETEKITNLFRLLNEQVELRQQKLKALGVTNFAAYRESGACDLPQILLLVDNLDAAKNYFPTDNDPLLSLCKEGISLGISVVATAAQPVGGVSYLPTFADRIALYNNDDSVYSSLLGHTKLRPKELPGRCLVSWENTAYECQGYLAFDAQREVDRAEAIRNFCQEQTAKANGKRAVPIPFIPKSFTADDAFSAYPEAYNGGRLMFGLDYATVKPFSVKLAALGMLAVSGRENDVKNFQRYLLEAAEKTDGLQAEFYIVDSIDHTLQPFSSSPNVVAYTFLPEHAAQMLLKVKEKAEERYAHVKETGDTSILDSSPTLVLMLNSNEAISAISSDKAALEAWQTFAGKLRSMNICTVFGNLDNVSIPYSMEILKKFKDDRKLVFFDTLSSLKIGDLPYATTKMFAGDLQKGDGYLLLGNEVARIRVPNCKS